MITNLKQFKLDLTNFRKVHIPAHHRRLCVLIALELHRLIVHGNSMMSQHPVDTGWSRANWGFYVGLVPPLGTYGEKPPQGSRINTVQNGTSVLATAGPFPLIWIYNNVPYIEILEDGHSKQAPTGMVEGAMIDIQVYLDNLPNIYTQVI